MDIFTTAQEGLRRSILIFILSTTSRSCAVVCQWVKKAMSNFDLSIFELSYNEVHSHSLKLYPFLSSKIIIVSQSLDYFSRKVKHFLKFSTVRGKIIPSSLKFSFLCGKNKAFNCTRNS